MSTTTAADLLERADLLTRTLRTDHRPVTPERWATFDRVAHRALTELLGPHGTWIPYTRTSGPLQTVVDHYPTPDRDARLSDGSPTDPHPLARLTRTLAAFADLMHQPDDVRADVLRSTGELANVTARVLTITAVAARYTMAHMPLREAMPPLTVGTFAEDMLAELPTVPDQRLDRGLRMVAAVTPTPPLLAADRLDLAINRWDGATADALDAAVPCADVLRTLATQGTHLYGVTARLYAHHDPAAVPPAFPTAVRDLGRVGETWIGGMTTLTPPSHRFVAASRDLYEQLARLDQQLVRDPDSLEPQAVAATLAPGSAPLQPTPRHRRATARTTPALRADLRPRPPTGTTPPTASPTMSGAAWSPCAPWTPKTWSPPGTPASPPHTAPRKPSAKPPVPPHSRSRTGQHQNRQYSRSNRAAPTTRR